MDEQLRTFTADELQEILTQHRQWLTSDQERGQQANLHHANLTRSTLDFRHADLRKANLVGANLSHMDLCGANLAYANLTGANLWGANLAYADFFHSNLSAADLYCADLCYADLRHCLMDRASFRAATLLYADFSDARLPYADLSDASLFRSRFYGADLHHATLSNVVVGPFGADFRGATGLDTAIGLKACDMCAKPMKAPTEAFPIVSEEDVVIVGDPSHPVGDYDDPEDPLRDDDTCCPILGDPDDPDDVLIDDDPYGILINDDPDGMKEILFDDSDDPDDILIDDDLGEPLLGNTAYLVPPDAAEGKTRLPSRNSPRTHAQALKHDAVVSMVLLGLLPFFALFAMFVTKEAFFKWLALIYIAFIALNGIECQMWLTAELSKQTHRSNELEVGPSDLKAMAPPEETPGMTDDAPTPCANDGRIGAYVSQVHEKALLAKRLHAQTMTAISEQFSEGSITWSQYAGTCDAAYASMGNLEKAASDLALSLNANGDGIIQTGEVDGHNDHMEALKSITTHAEATVAAMRRLHDELCLHTITEPLRENDDILEKLQQLTGNVQSYC